jgi:hypothetical protein
MATETTGTSTDVAVPEQAPRLVRRRVELVVEYWEDPAAIGAFHYEDPQWWAEAGDLQLYRVDQVQADAVQPVERRDYLLTYVGRPGPESDQWAVYDPTPGSGWQPVSTGTHQQCHRWIHDQGGTVRVPGSMSLDLDDDGR